MANKKVKKIETFRDKYFSTEEKYMQEIMTEVYEKETILWMLEHLDYNMSREELIEKIKEIPSVKIEKWRFR